MQWKLLLVVILVIACERSTAKKNKGGGKKAKIAALQKEVEELKNEIEVLKNENEELKTNQCPEPGLPSVGDIVWARWTNKLYYKGVIDSETDDEFHVKYDDGDEIDLRKDDTRAIVLDVIPPKSALTVGTEVIASRPGSVKYYPGRIDKVEENGQYDIKYEDGSNLPVSIDKIRVYNE